MMSYCRVVQVRKMMKMAKIINQHENITKCLMKLSRTSDRTLSMLTKCLTKPFCHPSTHFPCQVRQFHTLPGSFVFRTLCGREYMGDARRHTSSLFISDASSQNTAPVELDLRIDRRVAQSNELRRNLKIRGVQFDVDTFIEDYRLMKRLENEKRRLEMDKEKVAKSMAELKKQKNTDDDYRDHLIKRGKQIKEALKELQISWWVWEEKVIKSALSLPNDLRSQTPEEKDHIVDIFGDMSVGTCHLEIVKEKDLVKFSSAGPRAYYLKGELATLEQSLLQFVSDYLAKNNFHQLSCPEIFRSLVAEGCGIDYKNRNEIFTLYDKEETSDTSALTLDDLTHISGVSLMSFASYLTKAVVQTAGLPYRMFTTGRQYTADPDSDMPGLYGVTQSMKTAVLSVCSDRVSCMREFNKLAALTWSLYHRFHLHMRLVLVPGRDLLRCESVRVELQMWTSSLSKYVKVGHISCIDDYVSRRLMCYHSNNLTDYKTFHHQYMIYGEVLDVSRLLAVTLESNADETRNLLFCEGAFPLTESEGIEDILAMPEDLVS